MKKTEKRKLEDKLDAECRRIVREKYPMCPMCGRTNVQTCHIFSRSHKSTRWDLDNIIGLCYGHHIYFAHKEPEKFREWLIKLMGLKKYKALYKKAYQPKQWSVPELQKLLEELQSK
jgi:hypothetical protein